MSFSRKRILAPAPDAADAGLVGELIEEVHDQPRATRARVAGASASASAAAAAPAAAAAAVVLPKDMRVGTFNAPIVVDDDCEEEDGHDHAAAAAAGAAGAADADEAPLSPLAADASAMVAVRLAGVMNEMITCTICATIMCNAIYQCHAGHVVCNVCIEKLNQCHMCRGAMPAPRVRCLALEQARECMELACKFDGCAVKSVGVAALRAHTAACAFNRRVCPHGVCPFRGTEEAVADHAPHCESRMVHCPLWFISTREKCGRLVQARDVVGHLIHDDHKPIIDITEGQFHIAFLASASPSPDGTRWTNYYRIPSGDVFVLRATSAYGVFAASFRAITGRPLTGTIVAELHAGETTHTLQAHGPMLSYEHEIDVSTAEARLVADGIVLTDPGRLQQLHRPNVRGNPGFPLRIQVKRG